MAASVSLVVSLLALLISALTATQTQHGQTIIFRPIIQVPPPTVFEAHESVLTTWVFPGITLLAAVVAAGVSIILWRKALEQIDLARKALKASLDELELVKNDLEFSRSQVEYLNRQATPTLTLDLESDKMNYTDVPIMNEKRLLSIRLFVHNIGKKTARDASVILFIPQECRPTEWFGTEMTHPMNWYNPRGLRFIKNEEVEGARRDRVKWCECPRGLCSKSRQTCFAGSRRNRRLLHFFIVHG